MSITQSKCMTSLVVRGVDGRTDGRARARTSAKFRSPRDISPSHCAILLPASVDHPLAAGPPSFLPSFLPFCLLSFPPSFSLSPLLHSRRDNEFHSAALRADPIHFRSPPPRRRAPQRGASVQSLQIRSGGGGHSRNGISEAGCPFAPSSVRAPFYCISRVVCYGWRSFGSEIFSLLPAHCPINEMREEV